MLYIEVIKEEGIVPVSMSVLEMDGARDISVLR